MGKKYGLIVVGILVISALSSIGIIIYKQVARDEAIHNYTLKYIEVMEPNYKKYMNQEDQKIYEVYVEHFEKMVQEKELNKVEVIYNDIATFMEKTTNYYLEWCEEKRIVLEKKKEDSIYDEQDEKYYQILSEKYKNAMTNEDFEGMMTALKDIEKWMEDVERKANDSYVGYWLHDEFKGYEVSINAIKDGKVYGQIRYNIGSSAGFAKLDDITFKNGEADVTLKGTFVALIDQVNYQMEHLIFQEGSIVINGIKMYRADTANDIILIDGDYDA